MKKAESADSFSTAFIPLVLTLLFHRLNVPQGIGRENALIQLGKAQNQLGFTSGPSTPAFGSWVNNQTSFSSIHGNFSLRDMSGLYGALLNASAFGPFTNPSLLARCMNNYPPSKDCGLAINLLIYMKVPPYAQAAKSLIGSLLCPDPTVSCFNTSNNASILAIAQFITDPLPKFVLQYLEDQKYGLTTTRPQNQIILGYVMTNLPLPPQYPSGIPVPGPVGTYNNEEQAKAMKTNSTFYTCESTEGDRFTFAGKSHLDSLLVVPILLPWAEQFRFSFLFFPRQLQDSLSRSRAVSRHATLYEGD